MYLIVPICMIEALLFVGCTTVVRCCLSFERPKSEIQAFPSWSMRILDWVSREWNDSPTVRVKRLNSRASGRDEPRGCRPDGGTLAPLRYQVAEVVVRLKVKESYKLGHCQTYNLCSIRARISPEKFCRVAVLHQSADEKRLSRKRVCTKELQDIRMLQPFPHVYFTEHHLRPLSKPNNMCAERRRAYIHRDSIIEHLDGNHIAFPKAFIHLTKSSCPEFFAGYNYIERRDDRDVW